MPGTEPPKEGSTATVRVDYLLTLFLWAVGLILVLRFFAAFTILALGVLAAAIAASATRPLERIFPGPRWWSAMLSVALPAMFIVGLVLVMSWVLSEPVHKEIARLPEIRQQLDERLIYWSRRLGLEEQLTLKEVAVNLGRFLGGDVVATTAAVITNMLLALVFIFFGSVYLLGEKRDRLLAPALPLLPPARRLQLRAAIDSLEPKLRWWLVGTLVSMTVTGLASWIGYSLVGLQFAGPLALFAGMAEIVPTFGPVIAFLVALIFASGGSGTTIAGVIAVYVVIQTLESYVLQPLVMRQAVDVPPIVTLFSIVLWSKVFGAPGLILAIPIDLVIWTILDHFVLRPRAERAKNPT